MVYVDDYRAPYGRLLLSHMIADTEAELDRMAEALELRPEWKQPSRRSRGPHFDVSEGKRQEAIRLGAVAVTCRQLAELLPGDRYPPISLP